MKILQQLGKVSAQNLFHIFYLRAILLTANLAHTGSATPLYMIVEAKPPLSLLYTFRGYQVAT